MNILLLFSVAIFTFYIAWVWIKFGVQKSVSKSFYLHEGSALWYGWIIGWMFPSLVVGSSLTHIDDVNLVFFSCFCFGLVATAPDFLKQYKSMEWWVHMIGAYLGVGLITIALWYNFKQPIMFIIMVATLIGLTRVRNHIWWMELATYYIGIASMWLTVNGYYHVLHEKIVLVLKFLLPL